MQRFILVFLAVIGLISILFFFGGILLFVLGVTAWSGQQTEVADGSVLEIQFEQPVVENVPEDPVARFFMDDTLVLREIVDSIDRAAEDDRVVGLMAHVGGIQLGMAQLQEVRDALLRFQASGKPSVAFAETFGEFSPGNGSYYLATACDEIYMQPSGDLNLTGLYLEHPFLREGLSKIGVEAEIGQRYEYKNAANLYKEDEFTEPHREASQHLIDSLFGQMVRAMSNAREMSEDEIRTWIDRAPLLAAQAEEAGFVDGQIYLDEVYSRFADRGGDRFVTPSEYLLVAGRPAKGKNTVALVYGYGGIQRGESTYDGFGGSPVMGSDTVAKALRDATDNSSVKAIVFRVSSPGGSYVASDAVRREVVRARESGKPVVVSMGDYAASGGYFVSMAADRIYALPGTLTGSIGVYGGKMVLDDLMEKIGVGWDQVSTSENASIYSQNRNYTEQEWTRINAFLDHVYTDFTGKVASDRGLELEKVREVAKGRVWTGEDALELGLVDAIGGLGAAARSALELAELNADDGYTFRIFPGPKSTWELLAEKLENTPGTSGSMSAMVQAFEPAMATLRDLGLGSERDVLETSLPRVRGIE